MGLTMETLARFAPPMRRVVTHRFRPGCAVVLQVPVENTLLPFMEPCRVGGVAEHAIGGPIHLDRRDDRSNQFPSSNSAT